MSAQTITKTPFNWPIVFFLLFLTGIPAIPAVFLIWQLLAGLSTGVEEMSFVNSLYFSTPLAILFHGCSGIIFFLTMPFQFSPALRCKFIQWHKIGGKIAVTSGYVMGASGIWMHHVLSPDDLGMRYVSLLVMTLAMFVSFSLALWHITKGQFQTHRQWMIRAVAITLAAITPIFVDVIIYLLFNQFTAIYKIAIQVQHEYGRLLGIAINLAIVEYLFVREKRRMGKLTFA